MSRPGVEAVGGLVEIVLAVDGQVGTFREVLAQQAVRVLARAPLLGALRVEELDLDTGIDRELGVLGHLRFVFVEVDGEPLWFILTAGEDGFDEATAWADTMIATIEFC